jgi:hypothetical protein
MLKTVQTGAGSAVTGALNYQGTWNALTNSPALSSGVGTKGYYYVVNVAGTTNLDGITDWQIGDWAVFNGTAWQKVDNTDAVTSVNGQTGTVVLGANDVGATSNTTYVLAGTGISGGGRLNANVTITNVGVTSFNTRNGSVTLTSSDVTTALGYTPGTGNGTVTSVTATSPVASTGGTTPVISMPAANSTTSGYLTSTDWSTFNSKGSGTVTSVATGTGLTGGPITSTGTVSIANTGVTANTYGSSAVVPVVTVNAQGQLTAASNVTIVATQANFSNTAASATFATASLPLVPEGYVTILINGVNKKIPYYGV